MKLLNLGCGYPRFPEPEWTNLDNLHAHLLEGMPERENLDKEENYINFDVLAGPLPFPDETFDGVLASHFFEHFDAQDGLKLMIECRRILKPGGVLLVSVPDTAYFRKVYPEDKKHNWPRLFDVSDPGNPIPTFFEAALWFNEHKVMFTMDVLWCYLMRVGFSNWTGDFDLQKNEALHHMLPRLNRRIFSLEIVAYK